MSHTRLSCLADTGGPVEERDDLAVRGSSNVVVAGVEVIERDRVLVEAFEVDLIPAIADALVNVVGADGEVGPELVLDGERSLLPIFKQKIRIHLPAPRAAKRSLQISELG